MFDYALPVSRRQAILNQFPETGSRWISDYRRNIEKCMDTWQLTLLDAVDIGWPTNMIYFAENENRQPRVLKIGHPNPEMITEITTLQAYAGRSAVALLDADASIGALLLERIMPGTTLRQLGHDPANIKSAAQLMRYLPRQQTGLTDLPGFSGWMETAFSGFRADAEGDAEFLSYIEAAESAFELICKDSDGDYLLHGDLHHENILMDDIF